MPVVEPIEEIVELPFVIRPDVVIADCWTMRVVSPDKVAAVLKVIDGGVVKLTAAMKSPAGMPPFALVIACPTAMPVVDVMLVTEVLACSVPVVVIRERVGPAVWTLLTSHLPGTQRDGHASVAASTAVLSSVMPSHLAPQIRRSAGVGSRPIQQPLVFVDCTWRPLSAAAHAWRPPQM
jgi:hypothetical protein